MNPTEAPPAQDRLELEIRDFGPIIEATLDLRPLTVLVGPSNTGKSYLAILIYALHRLWSAQVFGPSYLGGRFRSWHLGDFEDPSEPIMDAAVEFLKRITDRGGQPSAAERLALPASITRVLSRGYDRRGGHLDEEIRRCFGIEESAALIRRGAQGGAGVGIRIRHRGGAAAVVQDFRIEARQAKFRITIPEDAKWPADRIGTDRSPWLFDALAGIRSVRHSGWSGELRDAYRFELLEALAIALHPLTVGPLAGGAFYLPADRTGVMHAHHVVVSALIGSAAMAGVRPAARTPVLSGVLADFLEELIALGQRPGVRRRSKSSRSLGAGIETAILKGSIRVEKSKAVGYPHFTYSPEGWKESLSLANASSMVSELAPVVLYLRHRVEAGNLLIIEEPESHLHPAMQVQLTEEIAALVQAGVRVVVTTHSEWVLEKLANLVGRSGLPEAGAELPEGRTSLSARDVGVWLFEPKERPRGSVVREIPLDESGLYPTGFGEVAAALHNDWADLSGQSRDPG